MKKLILFSITLFLIGFLMPQNAESCEIWDVQAQVQECNDDGFFYVILDFEFNGVGDNGFRVQGNGNNYGNYTWNQVPVQIGPLEGDGETVYEFVVIDNANEGCSDWTAIDPVDCNTSGGCNIWDVEADVMDCNEDDFFYVLLNFEFENIGNDGFHVQGNGTNYGNFGYDDIPVEIGPLEGDGVTVYEFAVIDNSIEGCSDWTTIDPVDCEGGSSECGIGELQLDVLPCNDAGNFMTVINFEYEGVSEAGFNAYVNNIYLGNYSYSELPVDVGPLEGDGETVYNFIVVDAEFEDCHRWKAIDPVDCNGNNSCWMGEMLVEVLPCNDDYQYYAEIDFEHGNTSGDGFKLYVNDDLYGNFSYDDLPLEVGPLNGDGVTDYSFFASDNIFEGCNTYFSMEAVDCGQGDAPNNIDEDQVLFPNPIISNGIMQFNKGLSDPKDVFLYDLHGNEVLRLKEFTGEGFQLPSMEEGMYFYRISAPEGSYKGKFSVK